MSIGLAVFHGQQGFLRAGISGDDLHLEAKHFIQDQRKGAWARARSSSTHHHRTAAQLLERLCRRLVGQQEKPEVLLWASDPVELLGLELIGGGIGCQQGCQCHFACQQRQDRAVTWRDRRHVIGCPDTASTGHVAHDECRLARNQPAEMTRDDTAILIVTAANRIGDDQLDGLARIKVRRADRLQR